MPSPADKMNCWAMNCWAMNCCCTATISVVDNLAIKWNVDHFTIK